MWRFRRLLHSIFCHQCADEVHPHMLYSKGSIRHRLGFHDYQRGWDELNARRREEARQV